MLMFGFFKKNNTLKEEFNNFGTGKLIHLEEVDDPVFAQKMMGDGYALELTHGQIVAPISATVTMVFPTSHAIGLTTDDGLEILLHLGIDTVQLNGKGFETLVKENDKVKQGELLSTMDLDIIKKHGFSTTSMCIFTSGQQIELLRTHENVTPTATKLFKFK